MGKRFAIEVAENSESFTLVKINTGVELWRTNKRVRDLSQVFDGYATAGNGFHTWCCEGLLSQDEKTELTSAHPRTCFVFKVIEPEHVTRVYRVAYRNRYLMVGVGFLKSQDTGAERKGWYYLVPRKIDEKFMRSVLH